MNLISFLLNQHEYYFIWYIEHICLFKKDNLEIYLDLNGYVVETNERNAKNKTSCKDEIYLNHSYEIILIYDINFCLEEITK